MREDAVNSVKATFLIDALAKEENISVSDGEVAQTIYYEAMMSGQDPEQVIKYYQDNNLIPAIKMGIVEDKLFSKILKLDRYELYSICSRADWARGEKLRYILKTLKR